MLVAVIFACACLLQEVKFVRCQVIGAESCKSIEANAEEDAIIKMKQLYGAFDHYQVHTGSELRETKARIIELETKQIQKETELQDTKLRLAELETKQIQKETQLQNTKNRLEELETKQKQDKSDLEEMKTLLVSAVKQIGSLGKYMYMSHFISSIFIK